MREFVALDDQPFSVVEDNGFRRLMAHFEPRYNLPSRLSDVSLSALYDVVAAHIPSLTYAKVINVCFITDIWNSDVSPVIMLGLTARG